MQTSCLSANCFRFEDLLARSLTVSRAGATTTHGIQVRSDFAEKYPELVVAYLKATLEADRLIRENPEKLSEDIAKWTGIDAEVVYAFHGPQGIQTRDYTGSCWLLVVTAEMIAGQFGIGYYAWKSYRLRTPDPLR